MSQTKSVSLTIGSFEPTSVVFKQGNQHQSFEVNETTERTLQLFLESNESAFSITIVGKRMASTHTFKLKDIVGGSWPALRVVIEGQLPVVVEGRAHCELSSGSNHGSAALFREQVSDRLFV